MSDIGDVLDVVDVVAAEAQPAHDGVEADVALGVSEVAVAVDGWSTDVHADLGGGEGGELYQFAAERVVDL